MPDDYDLDEIRALLAMRAMSTEFADVVVRLCRHNHLTPVEGVEVIRWSHDTPWT